MMYDHDMGMIWDNTDVGVLRRGLMPRFGRLEPPKVPNYYLQSADAPAVEGWDISPGVKHEP